MAAKRRMPDRAFLTASQSLQHRLVDAHLAGGRTGAAAEPQHLGGKAYQQAPPSDTEIVDAPERKRATR